MGKVLQTKGTADAKVLRRNKYSKVMSGLGQSEMCAEAESLKALVCGNGNGFRYDSKGDRKPQKKNFL